MIGDATLIDDRSLLEHYARTRDAKAFNELARRYAGLVYGTCLRVTRNPDDAQDVSQECFLELARRAGTIRSSLAGWLHKVARTRSINAIRRDSALRNREKWAYEDCAAEAGSEWAEIAPLVDTAVEKLPDHLRLPVILHYFHGLEQTQVAVHLHVNQSTVSRRLDKAVEAMRKDLQKAGVALPVAALALLLGGKASTAAPAALTATLGKMAITGFGGAAVSHSTAVITQFTANYVLGTLAGKLAVGALVGVVACSVAYRSTQGTNPEAAYAASPAVRHAPAAARVQTVAAPVADRPPVAVSPMETYRGDPFAPAGYVRPANGERTGTKAPIYDLPIPRIALQKPVSRAVPSFLPPPVQPSRRMSGLVLNNGVAAVIESNGKAEVVVPGQVLKDRLAVVSRIENNRVILKTTGDSPINVVVGLAPSPDAGQSNPPTAPGTPIPVMGPRPVMAPGVPVMRLPGARMPAARRGAGGAMMMPAVRR